MSSSPVRVARLWNCFLHGIRALPLLVLVGVAVSPFAETALAKENFAGAFVLGERTDVGKQSSQDRVVFVDAAVPDLERLLKGIPPSVEVIVLDSGRDGIMQIAEFLGTRAGTRARGRVTTLDLISHGSPGRLLLGGSVFDPVMSRAQAALLTEIGDALADGARILVYGCRFGAGESGRRAVQALAKATGAVVVASEDVTGSVALGGDWDFEISTDQSFVVPVVDSTTRLAWREVLQTTPTLQFSDLSMDAREDVGTVNIEVELMPAATGIVKVDWETQEREATSNVDYTSARGTLTFQPGDERKQITLFIIDDDQDEEDREGFRVVLSNPVGATFQGANLTVFIMDEDPQPTISIENVSVSEGTDAVFTVRLTPASNRVVIVHHETSDGSATAPEDYETASGVLSFNSGETQKTFNVRVVDDAITEGNEEFGITLTFPVLDTANASFSNSTATGTIVDNEDSNNGNEPDGSGDGKDPSDTGTDNETPDDGDDPDGNGNLPAGIFPEISRTVLSSVLDAVANCRKQAKSGTRTRMTAPVDRVSSWQELPRHETLSSSSFGLSLADGTGSGFPNASICGSGDYQRFSGKSNVAWTGKVYGTHLGASFQARDGVRAGIVVSRFVGSLDRTGRDGTGSVIGTTDIGMSGVQPYLEWVPSDSSNLWASAGYTTGDIEVVEHGSERQKSDATQTTFAVGGSLRLDSDDSSLPGGWARIDLAGEVGFAQFDVKGNGRAIRKRKTDSYRLRLSLEASQKHTLGSGAIFSPSVKIGVRQDENGGDSRTGLEAGGAIHYSDPAMGLALIVEARALAANGNIFDEWGLGSSILYDLNTDGRGLLLSLLPSLGALTNDDPDESAARKIRRPARLGAEAGYGVSMPRNAGILTVYIGFDVDDDGPQGYRAGSRLNGRGFDLDLELRGNDVRENGPDWGLFLEGQANW